jgi:acyl-CoA oxidase
MKFWIGAAGQTANMAVIWAQLYIKDKCYGVHAFVVPIRDLQTHRPLPGVTVGDCGPKMGLNGIDNGFMLFDKVRIPATNLLDRISGVD